MGKSMPFSLATFVSSVPDLSPPSFSLMSLQRARRELESKPRVRLFQLSFSSSSFSLPHQPTNPCLISNSTALIRLAAPSTSFLRIPLSFEPTAPVASKPFACAAERSSTRVRLFFPITLTSSQRTNLGFHLSVDRTCTEYQVCPFLYLSLEVSTKANPDLILQHSFTRLCPRRRDRPRASRLSSLLVSRIGRDALAARSVCHPKSLLP
jgi:hypothetical protein